LYTNATFFFSFWGLIDPTGDFRPISHGSTPFWKNSWLRPFGGHCKILGTPALKCRSWNELPGATFIDNAGMLLLSLSERRL